MKNIADIERFHDVLSAALQSKDENLTEEKRETLLTVRNALCWVLEHEPAKTDMGRWLAAAAVRYGARPRMVH